jgi:hypothetical protein
MQEITGSIVLLIIVIISACNAWEYGSDTNEILLRIVKTFFAFIFIIVVFYAVIAFLCGIAWIVAWIGILIRSILQWVVESVLSPFRWFF